MRVDADQKAIFVQIKGLHGAFQGNNWSVDLWYRVEAPAGNVFLRGDNWNVTGETSTVVRLASYEQLPKGPWDAFVVSYHELGGDQVYRMRCSLRGDNAPEAFEGTIQPPRLSVSTNP